MSEIRDDRQYTESHEWILDNGDGTYTMGITEHAQALLGEKDPDVTSPSPKFVITF
jgi:glycine cleavage system H protein